ncbi:chromosome transmission fidelity protein 4 [Exophiala viscosa]|uniref:Chromosome transmission fidelity protein 4 n=1 Tax=Exophiala viscosa TaxID=2486360 RepID=A0AAN6IFR1_9EURO|nr:chromosome transmission fidelity protein 4 [Exophiala viscosa]
MTSMPMRKLPIAASRPSTTSRWLCPPPSGMQVPRRHRTTAPGSTSLRQILPRRYLAQVRPEPVSELWFTAASPRLGPADELLGRSTPGNNEDHKPPDQRLLKLGKTLRTLSPLLPDILTTPLPQEILAPEVSLHLFPSTHPHLPAVKGRMAYRAALFTAPVAWGCVPIVGNVKLKVVSEKIVRTGLAGIPLPEDENTDLSAEKLVVRWKTEAKQNGNSNNATAASSAAQSNEMSHGGINKGLSKALGGDKPIISLNKGDEFTGLFIFTFDSEGRIASHTIEHADENSGFDKTSKMVTLTDWLLGKAKWSRMRENEQDLVPGLAMRVCRQEWNDNRRFARSR